MKNTTHTTRTTRTTNAALKNSAPATAATNSKTADEIFFADETDIANDALNRGIEVITRLLIWSAEGANMPGRGARITVALHCIRPDLIGGVTLEQIGHKAGLSKQAVYKLAQDFHVSMGF